mmetsp:Transcript_8227/g.21560  ORF Transcript_8227/g.21560 Transcript_8227/m.21560 type:complete len:243 (+) Transcript_8227:923-1651(+)
MSAELRSDLFADLLECEQQADLAIAVGTSLCGMNADRVVSTPASKAPRRALGSVIIGLQRTALDVSATLRIFGACDTVFEMLTNELGLEHVPLARSEGVFFVPPVLEKPLGAGEVDDERYLLRGLRYDAFGSRLPPSARGDCLLTLDLRDGAQLIIPTGQHAGAVGEVDGVDREGHPKCRFRVKLKRGGSFRVPYTMVLGTWWMQAAAEATVCQLPVVNIPALADTGRAACKLREARAAYEQ